LDLEGLRECVSSHRHLDKIKGEIKEADALGLRSTPSIWINGRRVERPTPDAIEKIFEEILRESGVAIPERD
jgi:protein-disulfide isomerase